MAGERAALGAGEDVARGMIAKAAASVLRDAEGPVVRDVADAAARDGASAASKSAAKSAARTSVRDAGKDVGSIARRRVPVRNDSGLARTADTAEARRAFDKLHGSEPDWGAVTERYHGPRPEDMARPHGHHIVFKEGRPGPVRDVLAESKQILERHGVDWYTGRENLIWAPNQGHSLANAEAVRDALRAAEPGGRDALVAALRHAGRTVFGGKP
jgi:hypothetical protein